MWDRKLKKLLKGKVLECCMVAACVYWVGNTYSDSETGEAKGSREQLG